MRTIRTLLLYAAAAALFQIAAAPDASASPILAPELASFALFGGGGVQVNGAGSVITGSVGGFPNTSITGYPAAFSDSGGTVYTLPSPIFESAAHTELNTAMLALNNMALGSTTPLGASLGTTTLNPGVYTTSAALDLTGTLTLDGLGNANALWVFLIGSSLTADTNSAVNVIDAGANAGVYWVTVASATLNGPSTFAGNILASTAISTTGTAVTDSCGRLLAYTASVSLAGDDTIGIGCLGLTAAQGGGSNSFSGGGTISIVGNTPVVTPLPSTVPEPATLVLFGTGIAELVARRRRSARPQRRDLALKA